MLKSITNTSIFGNLAQDIKRPSHAYLFYGEDNILNEEVAKVFVASIFCGKVACFECESCKRTIINKNPDLLIIDKPSIQVADIESLIDNVQLKPMVYDYRVVLITNADGINERAQNKLLKTLEEPNSQLIFILCCTNLDKLLPTVRSRLNKRYIPLLDLGVVAEELKSQGVNIDKFVHCDITLGNAIKYSSANEVELLNVVEQAVCGLKSSANIPNVVEKLKIKPEQRKQFLTLLLSATNCALTSQSGVFDTEFIQYMQQTFNVTVLIKMMKLIDKASMMLDANVNFNYILDQLFYNILKEKYLCK